MVIAKKKSKTFKKKECLAMKKIKKMMEEILMSVLVVNRRQIDPFVWIWYS